MEETGPDIPGRRGGDGGGKQRAVCSCGLETTSTLSTTKEQAVILNGARVLQWVQQRLL